MTEVVLPEYPHPMQQAVALFHRSFASPDRILDPGPLPLDRVEIRVKLIHEEGVDELAEAINLLASSDAPEVQTKSAVLVIDALVDTLYVALGGLVEMGRRVQDELRYGASPSFPGLSIRIVGTATRVAIQTNLEALEAALLAQDEEASVHLFSAIAQDAHQALLWAGYDPVPFFDEVQRANMSKLDADGNPVISRGEELDGFPKGKILKGAQYVAPDLARVHRELYEQED